MRQPNIIPATRYIGQSGGIAQGSALTVVRVDDNLCGIFPTSEAACVLVEAVMEGQCVPVYLTHASAAALAAELQQICAEKPSHAAT